MGASSFVHLEDCTVRAVTDRAVLIEYENAQYWLPVSQLADREAHNLHRGDHGVPVSITEWIAEQKGIDA